MRIFERFTLDAEEFRHGGLTETENLKQLTAHYDRMGNAPQRSEGELVVDAIGNDCAGGCLEEIVAVMPESVGSLESTVLRRTSAARTR